MGRRPRGGIGVSDTDLHRWGAGIDPAAETDDREESEEPAGDPPVCTDCGEQRDRLQELAPYGVVLCPGCYLAREGL